MRLFLFIIGIFFSNPMSITGQIMADSILAEISLNGNPNVSAMRTGPDTSFEEIKKLQNWKPYDSTYPTTRKDVIWLKFEIENASKDTVYNYFFSQDQYVTIYQQHSNGFKALNNGLFVPLTDRVNKTQNFFTQLHFAPLERSQVYVRLHIYRQRLEYNEPFLYSEKEYWKKSKEIEIYESKSIAFIYFYIISLSTIIVFAAVFWISLRKNLYLYYLGYLIFQLIYGFLVLRTTIAPFGNFFNHWPQLAYNLFEPVQFIFISFYIFFILHLLRVRNYDARLANILKYLGMFCMVYALARFAFSKFYFDPNTAKIFFTAVRLIVLPINFILIFWIIYKVKHHLLVYFIVGQFFFFVGALLASYIGLYGIQHLPDNLFNFKEAPNVIFQTGLLAEVYCFSIALGQNIFVLQKEKNVANDALIAQYKENRLLQEQMNQELDRKVNEKTSELIELYTQLERQKEKEIKADFTQKLKEMEMMALRSRMNPHFLFNSLNAIKHLIMTSRNDDAIEYLDNFSTLLRSILQNSNREVISVEEELEILELYLSLEKSRMGENFNYTIETSSREELYQYYIPPLFLQPFAENAIWHGLNPSDKKDKNISVIFDTTENLKIIIEDNGIGRYASNLKQKLHKSMGMEITKERLSLFNYLNTPSIFYEITDLGTTEEPLGTRVTLTYRD